MRRHDLDWLRLIVFALLILYHVGMFFVPWDFHIKNNHIHDWLRYPMWFLNQWRLPILFVISGMGTYYTLQRRSGKQFVIERIKKLLIPLAFGMLFIIPPQVYLEKLTKNQFKGDYFEFWPVKAFIGTYPEGNLSWHHLWFLPYLLLFSLALIPVFLYLKNHIRSRFTSWLTQIVQNPLKIYLFIIPLYLVESFVEPFFEITHALIDDWFTIINYIIIFLYGFLLIMVKGAFWFTVEKYRKYFLIAGLVCFSVMLLIVEVYEDSIYRHFIEAFLKVANLWSWILAIFGFASKYLNRKSKILYYCNEAVYPFYILHQTIMMVMAYYIMNLEWSLGLKASIMVVGTFGFSWFIYEFFVRRWKFMRPLFGLKKELANRISKYNNI